MQKKLKLVQWVLFWAFFFNIGNIINSMGKFSCEIYFSIYSSCFKKGYTSLELLLRHHHFIIIYAAFCVGRRKSHKFKFHPTRLIKVTDVEVKDSKIDTHPFYNPCHIQILPLSCSGACAIHSIYPRGRVLKFFSASTCSHASQVVHNKWWKKNFKFKSIILSISKIYTDEVDWINETLADVVVAVLYILTCKKKLISCSGKWNDWQCWVRMKYKDTNVIL